MEGLQIQGTPICHKFRATIEECQIALQEEIRKLLTYIYTNIHHRRNEELVSEINDTFSMRNLLPLMVSTALNFKLFHHLCICLNIYNLNKNRYIFMVLVLPFLIIFKRVAYT